MAKKKKTIDEKVYKRGTAKVWDIDEILLSPHKELIDTVYAKHYKKWCVHLRYLFYRKYRQFTDNISLDVEDLINQIYLDMQRIFALLHSTKIKYEKDIIDYYYVTSRTQLVKWMKDRSVNMNIMQGGEHNFYPSDEAEGIPDPDADFTDWEDWLDKWDGDLSNRESL